jgi:hypothetical protein
MSAWALGSQAALETATDSAAEHQSEQGEVDVRKRKNKAKKKQKSRKKGRVQQQWKSEQGQILSLHRKAPYMKMILRSRGFRLPFFDFLDSYEAEFAKLVDEYLASRPTLIGIYEVADEELESTDWERFGGAADWQQVFYNYDDDPTETYGREGKRVNVKGSTVTLRDTNGGLHTMVRICRNIKCAFQHKELKYAAKIPALLHEIGHVIDIEERINFDPEEETCRIIDAEVFANRYALEQCVQRGYRQSLVTWLDSWRGYVDAKDYRGEVARRSLDGAPSDSDVLDWNTLLSQEITEGEKKMIGERGRQALGGG